MRAGKDESEKKKTKKRSLEKWVSAGGRLVKQVEDRDATRKGGTHKNGGGGCYTHELSGLGVSWKKKVIEDKFPVGEGGIGGWAMWGGGKRGVWCTF